MTKKEAIKGVTKLALCFGTTTIVSNTVKHAFYVTRMTTIQSICVSVATAIISGMACEKLCEYTDMKIDQFEEELVRLSEEDKKRVDIR